MPNDIALRALATRAVDPYNKRHIREAGEDLFRMLRRYREREAWAQAALNWRTGKIRSRSYRRWSKTCW